MKIPPATLFVLMLTFIGCDGEQGLQGPMGPAGNSIPVVVPDDYPSIQEAVNALPPEGGSVLIRAGLYTLTRGVHVNRSHVAISGEPGALLRLADNVNEPVLLLGTDAEAPTETIRNLRIENLEIDGNKAAQTSETDPSRPWIRNNGIDVRKVEALWIRNVHVHDSRSGGIVVSWASSDIFVSASIFSSNFFDGIALYDSRAVQISDFECRSNAAAGLSLDNNLSDVRFSTGRVESNGDVGIFARDSSDLVFSDVVIADNGSHGAFLSHQAPGNGTGVQRLFINGCSFLDNDGYGIWLASPVSDSPDNVVANTLFSGNTAGAINLDPGAAITEVGNIMQ